MKVVSALLLGVVATSFVSAQDYRGDYDRRGDYGRDYEENYGSGRGYEENYGAYANDYYDQGPPGYLGPPGYGQLDDGKGYDYPPAPYDEQNYAGDGYSNGNSCRYISFDEVQCKKVEVKKVSVVTVDDFVQECKTMTFTEKKSITVKIKRDVCESRIKPILVTTTIPVTKQVCDDFPKNSYGNDKEYKKTPDCKIVKSEKVIQTTDHVTKWHCKPEYKEQTITVPVKFHKQICKEVPVPRKVQIPVWVKEKACWVETKSKKVCGTTDVEKIYAKSGSQYTEDDDGDSYLSQDKAYDQGYDESYDQGYDAPKSGYVDY